jgi:hypothetical protein
VHEFDRADEDLRHDIWYTPDEYDIIKARNSLLVKMARAGSFSESDEHTFRGLEHKLREGHRQRRANKFSALNAVLEEQDRQCAVGRVDSHGIASAYVRATRGARERAFHYGLRDAEESAGGGHGDGAAAAASSSSASASAAVIKGDEEASEVSDLDTTCSGGDSSGNNGKKRRASSRFSRLRRRASM